MIIKPREGRAIKNKNSTRVIPLVGVSFDAMRAFPNGFPTYRDSDATLSATVNKYLRANGLMESDRHVMYSLRHSFEDRLLPAGVAASTKAIEELGFSSDTDRMVLQTELEQLSSQVERLRTVLPELDMSRLATSLERASNAYAKEHERDREAERTLSRTRQKEADAKELHDSVRKASNDALNQRLDRILPLITELYARLRPHPNFQDIKYKIRGELRRHLSFSVGDDINSRFVYSSGQRRATGLAFLIAVNFSMAWSRWSSILLDDPVQHIDDFRSVHLAELLGKLVSEGKQVICAVEDPALADLISRKVPVSGSGVAKRITLGIGENGRVVVSNQSDLVPMRPSVLVDHQSTRAV
ncbi:hypothetical protein [Pseudooctadecabacter jejudonensis]|uniref:Chromosome segregation protein n=1 Tax=Pseudooctadecabacter jejudonensis TaxID=1391910 RepID=A0A1Y5SIQ9_9RHOB|nr:hypothetical protein [Pseudooctadecabacter jejudonensis]SLN38552.1 chromosome segregation protein [Pseudooctadecabacter jejudonensis]